MANQIEEIKLAVERAKEIISNSEYGGKVVYLAKALIAANELLQQQQWQPIEKGYIDAKAVDIIRSLEAKVESLRNIVGVEEIEELVEKCYQQPVGLWAKVAAHEIHKKVYGDKNDK